MMDNLPTSGFHFAGEDYGSVDFPGSLQGELQQGLGFSGAGGPVFPQNQRGAGYGMPAFHLGYAQQSVSSMTNLSSGAFRSRFSDYVGPDPSSHVPMPVPSASAGLIADRLPSFSTIVSSSGGSSGDMGKTSQVLYSNIGGQQHAFQASEGGRILQPHFESTPYADQISSRGFIRSPSLRSTSPGMVSSNYSNMAHSASLQNPHASSGQHMPPSSPRTFKEEMPAHQQYLAGAMHADRFSFYGHSGMSHNHGDSMALPKLKHKYLSHNQHLQRRNHAPFRFFIFGPTERPSLFNKGTQTEESFSELKIVIPKPEMFKSGMYKPDLDKEFSEGEGSHRRLVSMDNQHNQTGPGLSPRITFPYDAHPSHNTDYRVNNKNSKVKTVISPSFLDSAGKATMTTCVANKATIVTVGIVSRPGGLVGPEPTSSVYPTGLMATGMTSPNSRHHYLGHDTNLRASLDSVDNQHSDNYDHVLEQRKARARHLEQERMEVSVRIDDTQFVQVGEAKRWQCTECDKSYTTKHNLVMHVLDHSGIKPHLCLKCGKYFKQLSHLNTHMLTHDKIKPHTCNLCGKGFTQISHLKRHAAVSEKNGYCATLRPKPSHDSSPQSTLEPNKPHTNPNTSFHGVNTYNHSDIKEEDDAVEGKISCRYCDRKFRFPSQLKDHMQSHDGHRPYMCIECGMDFLKEHHLKAHQFTHTGLKPYSCDICGRSFNQRANLLRHKLIHDNSRTYKCHTCDKLFTQPQTLKAHQVIHADRKPYECNICGKEFGRSHNLQGHMHMHTNSKPYVCFCGSTFTLKGNLNRHKKIKHGLNETTDVMEEDAVNFLSSLSERARDDHQMNGEVPRSPSPGSGAEGESRASRKGRKSIPRKITLPEGEEQTELPAQPMEVTEGEGDGTVRTQTPETSSLQTTDSQKPFVLPNPDTDEELGEEERDREASTIQNLASLKAANEATVVMNCQNESLSATGVMNCQPQSLSVTGCQPESLLQDSTRTVAEEVEIRPRRQSQRHSPMVQMGLDQDEDTEEDNGDSDDTDVDWVPGSGHRLNRKSDGCDKMSFVSERYPTAT